MRKVYPHIYAAIAVEFDQNSYQVMEGESVSVCVILVGETDQAVTVTLTSQQDTATGQNLLITLMIPCIKTFSLIEQRLMTMR